MNVDTTDLFEKSQHILINVKRNYLIWWVKVYNRSMHFLVSDPAIINILPLNNSSLFSNNITLVHDKTTCNELNTRSTSTPYFFISATI